MTPIYHITHVDNLPSILQATCLWSDAQRIKQGFASTNIGYRHIKERRLHRPVPVAVRGMLGDYVPFNFCNRSVMLYVIHRGNVEGYTGGQVPVVHLVSSVEAVVASGRPWAFTDRHADLHYASYYDDLASLDEVDWSVMPLTYWASDQDTKERRQAEFLAHDWFPWDCVESIGVYNQQVADQVAQVCTAAAHRPEIRVESGWYY